MTAVHAARSAGPEPGEVSIWGTRMAAEFRFFFLCPTACNLHNCALGTGPRERDKTWKK